MFDLATQMKLELSMWYLDECTFGSDVEVVMLEIQKIVTVGGVHGLLLNMGKCELLSVAGCDTGVNEAYLTLSQQFPGKENPPL